MVRLAAVVMYLVVSLISIAWLNELVWCRSVASIGTPDRGLPRPWILDRGLGVDRHRPGISTGSSRFAVRQRRRCL